MLDIEWDVVFMLDDRDHIPAQGVSDSCLIKDIEILFAEVADNNL